VRDEDLVEVGGAVLRRARHVAEALFATEGGSPEAARIDRLMADFADFLGRAPGRGRLVMGFALFFLTWLAPLFIRRLGPLGALSLDERARALARVEAGGFATAALAPKAILCFLWFEAPETQRETGTVPTCLRS
jgi:hypothetical protein